jgi:hypothetical protein
MKRIIRNYRWKIAYRHGKAIRRLPLNGAPVFAYA